MRKKRKVIFIPGLDLKDEEYYYRKFIKESKKQEKINNYIIKTSKIKNTNRSNSYFCNWKVYYQEEDKQVITDYDFFCWSTLLKKTLLNKGFRFVFFSLRAFCIVFINHSLFSLVKSHNLKKSYYAYLGPYIILFSIIFIYFSCLIGGILLKNKVLISSWILIILAQFLCKKRHVINFMKLQIRTSNFIANNSNSPLILQPTVNIISEYILKELAKQKYDEILICSHSAGGIIAIKAIANLIEKKIDFSKLSFLSLGSTAPIFYLISISKNKKSNFLKELKSLINNQIVWIDVTSKADGAAPFPAFDYLKNDKKYPIKISPQFHKMMSASRYDKLKKNIYLLHFQYLSAGENRVNYDFFKFTVGHHNLFYNNSEP